MSVIETIKRLRVLIVTQADTHGVKQVLNNHDITLVSKYEEALRQLKSAKYDAVITDLHIVVSDESKAGVDFDIGETMPYGIPIVIEALINGVPHIGVIVDQHHKKDSLITTFNYFKEQYRNSTDIKIVMIDSVKKNRERDWDTMINQLLSNISSVK